MCVCQVASVMSDSLLSYELQPTRFLSMGFCRQEYWSGLPYSPLGILPNSGIDPPSSTSPASADGFFTTSATWEIPETDCIYSHLLRQVTLGFPGGSEVKASASNMGDLGLIPGLGRSPGEGNGNPVQYSYLENPMDRGAWQATVHRVAKVAPLHFHFLSLLM